MKKGICFHWGFIISPEQKAQILSAVGFDSVIANADPKFDYQNGTFKEQVKLFKKYKLTPSTLHMQHDKNEISAFWEVGKKGDNLEKTLEKDILFAHKYGFSAVVVHLKSENPNPVGLERIKRLLELCKKKKVFFAVENITKINCLQYVFDNIDHPYLKLCYDIGHNNCFHKDFDVLAHYGDKLHCLHLHDNDGSADQHTLNRLGNIDWNAFAVRLAKLGFNGSLDYEVIYNPNQFDDAKSIAEEVYNQALELERLIAEYKKI